MGIFQGLHAALHSALAGSALPIVSSGGCMASSTMLACQEMIAACATNVENGCGMLRNAHGSYCWSIDC